MKKIAVISLLLAALVATSSCNQGNTKNQVAAPTNLIVRTEPVTLQEVSQINEFTATVEANIVNNIAPTMSVRINKIFVEVGDFVRAGQKLVQMDNNNLSQAKTQLDNLETSFKRIDELYKVGGVSRSEWDLQKTNLDIARTSYENLVENTQLLSPINGVITARNYDSGDLYTMGRAVLVVEQVTPVKLIINVSEQFYTKVKKGMPVDIRLDVYPGEVFQGKVSLVYPTITSTTRTFPVEITVPNTNTQVRPGMFARVTIDLGTAQSLMVSDQAVVKQRGSGERYLYVYKDGKAEYRLLNLGRRVDNQYVVLSGVEEGELVITTGLDNLTNGAEVELLK